LSIVGYAEQLLMDGLEPLDLPLSGCGLLTDAQTLLRASAGATPA